MHIIRSFFCNHVWSAKKSYAPGHCFQVCIKCGQQRSC